MATTVSELQVVVSADTKSAESSLSTFSSKLGSVGSTMALAFGTAAVAGVAALGAGLAAATGSAAGFEKQLSSIKAVSGSTAAEMEQMRALALQLGADTAFSATEAAQGIEELVKAGVSVGDVLGGGAAAAMNLAAAGAVSVKDAAELTSNALNAFGLAGADAARVADLIAGAANASAIDVGDFKFSLAAVGAVANTVGFSIEDTAAAIALLGNAGIKGSDAGTSLKTMFLNLQPTTKEQISLFRELGLLTAEGGNAFFDASGKVKSMSEVAGTLQNALKGMTDQQKLATLETIFGSDAIRAAAVFVKEGAAGMDEMAAAMSKVTAESVAQERLNNLSGSWEQLTGALETAAITLGSHLLPPLTQLVKMGDGMVSDLIPSLDAVGAAIGGALTQGITTAKDLFRQLGDAWRTVQQAFSGGWEPSAEIEPLANAAGNAALKVKELTDWLQRVNEAASRMGAWDGYARTLTTIATEAGRVSQSVGQIGEALERFDAISGKASSSGDGVARVLSAIGTAAQVSMIPVAAVIDTFATMASVGLELVNGLFAVGRGFYALANGDIPTFLAAGDLAEASFRAAGQAALDWANNNATRAQEAYTAIAGAAQTEMPAMAAAVTDGTTTAQAALDTFEIGAVATTNDLMAQMSASAQTGMTQVAGAVETGMGQAVGAVQAQGPLAVAAAEGMGTGMASGVQSAMPTMVSAAETGASSAVAAVSGQAGAASSAGHSVGSAAGEGMRSGILSAANSLASAAADVVRRALQAAKNALDIDSPSKVFANEVGKPIVQGVIQGVDAMSRPLDRTLSSMAAPPQSGGARHGLAMAPSGGAGGATYINLDARGAQVYDGSRFEDMLVNALGRAHRGGRISKVTL